MSARTPRPSPGDRLFRALLVHEKERGQVVYLLGFFLLVGAGMALGRGTADALFFKRYGIEHLPAMYVAMSLLLALTGILYATLADRLPAERFFHLISGLLAGILVVEWFFMRDSGAEHIYPVYFLTYEVVSEILLVHGALYLSQNLNTLQAKRLTPLVFGGAQVGSILGGIILATLVSGLGLHNILLIWCGLLGAGMLLLRRWHKNHGTSAYFRPQAHTRRQVARSIQQVLQTVRLARSSNLLRMASFALFFMVITFYIMCYSVNRVYTSHFASEESLAAFFGVLGAVTAGLALLLQVFVTNRFIERMGVRRVNLMFPLFSIISISALLGHFGLLTALFASFNKDTIMPAFRKPVREIIFNALPHAIQGRARAMSVILVLPLALLCCGGLLWALQRLDNPAWFLAPGVGFALTYFYFSRRMNHAYTRALVDHLEERLFLPDNTPAGALKGSGESGLKTLINGVKSQDDQVVLTFARTLAASFPAQAGAVIMDRLSSVSPRLADQLLKILADLETRELEAELWSSLQQGDSRLRATIYWFLFRNQLPEASELVADALRDDSARVRAAGIFGALHFPVPELRTEALKTWSALCADEPPVRINAIQLAELLPSLAAHEFDELARACRAVLQDLDGQADGGIIVRTLTTARDWPLDPLPELVPVLQELARDPHPERRVTAIDSLNLVPDSARCTLILHALDDPHNHVRCAAIRRMEEYDPDFEAQALRFLTTASGLSPRGQLALLETLVERGLPVDALFEIARTNTRRAQMLEAAIETLERHPGHGLPGIALLRTTLRERCLQTVDLALSALQATGDSRQVGIIRAAIRSGDERFVANAGEALRNLEHPELSRIICQILETLIHKADRSVRGQSFSGIGQVVGWCRETGDDWLRTTAAHADAELAGAVTA